MNYYSEQDIRDIVAKVLAQQSQCACPDSGSSPEEPELPVEISARHVHLTREAAEQLFGPGFRLTKKRDLSQPGEFLSNERVTLVTKSGQISNVAVLGPERSNTQVELSKTDTRTLGIDAPVRLSGNLDGAADVYIVGPAGMIDARKSVIIAKAHVHMTPADAEQFHVQDGQVLSLSLKTDRPITLEQVVVRVKENFRLAVHIDFDEANAGMVDASTKAIIVKRG